ncbi:Palmitoyl-acyl carrier protein thioesterase chloroplastic [Zea mays]|uniref:Acyl-[acyl-carrier-protein] hydrolase n=2 Tax=Zea mays TaxID=4577 RepID=A0A1D6K8H1_MAIZE|nr:Palmitoyl-acyl carrier protein thioesterase chloroplastic [Zea mays]ONL99819.1 Palmitoyl-acyl carrier protein thioesterase chloroplastic [Zea mays]ONL99822.1 Palmitoyl-acyl carrier protein thioesterase chloroplastic [Zea mays]
MSKRNLFWVVSQMQAIVERYPCWGDTVEVNTWVSANGKNGMRRDWHIRDSMTGHTTLKATSKWVMMNKLTRKLARIPDEVHTDIEPYFVGRSAIVDEDNSKLPKLPEGQSTCAAKYVRTGLTLTFGEQNTKKQAHGILAYSLDQGVSILDTVEIVIPTNKENRETTDLYIRSVGIDGCLEEDDGKYFPPPAATEEGEVCS